MPKYGYQCPHSCSEPGSCFASRVSSTFKYRPYAGQYPHPQLKSRMLDRLLHTLKHLINISYYLCRLLLLCLTTLLRPSSTPTPLLMSASMQPRRAFFKSIRKIITTCSFTMLLNSKSLQLHASGVILILLLSNTGMDANSQWSYGGLDGDMMNASNSFGLSNDFGFSVTTLPTITNPPN
jgi:hypothetical protein